MIDTFGHKTVESSTCLPRGSVSRWVLLSDRGDMRPVRALGPSWRGAGIP